LLVVVGLSGTVLLFLTEVADEGRDEMLGLYAVWGMSSDKLETVRSDERGVEGDSVSSADADRRGDSNDVRIRGGR
jgi:hypothetical protein